MSLRQIFNYFSIAGKLAQSRKDKRSFLLGAIGVRSDGVMVQAMNGASTHRAPTAHAEARLVKKLDKNATVYVARVLVSTGEFAMSRPCDNCMRLLRLHKVKRVYYTIGPREFGWVDL